METVCEPGVTRLDAKVEGSRDRFPETRIRLVVHVAIRFTAGPVEQPQEFVRTRAIIHDSGQRSGAAGSDCGRGSSDGFEGVEQSRMEVRPDEGGGGERGDGRQENGRTFHVPKRFWGGRWETRGAELPADF